MSIFKEVSLTWKSEEYTVSPDNVMGLIEVIEDVITLEEISAKINRSKISKAFACALRYAAQNSTPRKACNVTQQEVYTSLFAKDTGGNISGIITSLMMMMIPPEHLQDTPVKEEANNLSTAVKTAGRKSKSAKGS